MVQQQPHFPQLVVGKLFKPMRQPQQKKKTAKNFFRSEEVGQQSQSIMGNMR